MAVPAPPVAVAGGAAPAAKLYPRIETEMHTAMITRLAIDAAGHYAVTASEDKTARVWDLGTGTLLQVLRPPVGPGDVGELEATAMSPDGATVAVGGTIHHQIYLFDRASGRMIRRIVGLPSTVTHLAYSTDGSLLAAALLEHGIRVFRARDGEQLFADSEYGDRSLWVEFDRTGRLLTTSIDGYVRLYSRDFRPIGKQKPRGGEHPYSARFSPDGVLVAVGFHDSTTVTVLSGRDLSHLYFADTAGIDNQGLEIVAWSRDGHTLYAAGGYHHAGEYPVVSWEDAGRGPPRRQPLARNAVIGLQALPNGRLAYAAQDPLLGVTGEPWSPRRGEAADFRGALVWLSDDGRAVLFGYRTPEGEKVGAGWAIGHRALERNPATTTARPPRTEGLPITDWENSTTPRLAGQPLALEPYEISWALAIAADGQSFLLGTEWSLRYFDRTGKERWKVSIRGPACAVNISGDGQTVVAAFADGTIRWYRLSDGAELLALFVHADGQRWVAWTPQGFFDAGGGGEALVGYQVNHGPDRAGELIRLAQVQDRLYRPDLVAHALDPEFATRLAAEQKGVEELARQLSSGVPPAVSIVGPAVVQQSAGDYTLDLQVDDRGGGVGRIEYRINGVTVEARPFDINVPGRRRASLPLASGSNTITAIAYNGRGEIASAPATVTVQVAEPKTRPDLYGILVGVSQYRDANLHLNFADQDALALEQVLRQHGAALFGKVDITTLSNAQAKRVAIESALADVARKAQPQDVFVLYLAGHGVSLDGSYHFIPVDLVYENEASLRAGALGAEELKTLLGQVKAQKSVLIVDTCQSGGLATGELTILASSRGLGEKAALSRLMKATGRAVLAATSEQQWALEGYEQHGVFTYALLQALGADARAADRDGNGEIDVDELAQYLSDTVPKMTAQKWGIEQYPVRELTGQSFAIERYRSY